MNPILQKAVPFYRKQLEQLPEDYYRFTADQLIEFINQCRNIPDNTQKQLIPIIITSKHGAGFSSWNLNIPNIMFDNDVIQWIRNGKDPTQIEHLSNLLCDKYKEFVCTLGLENTTIQYVEQGQKFKIQEHGGLETLITPDDGYWMIA